MPEHLYIIKDKNGLQCFSLMAANEREALKKYCYEQKKFWGIHNSHGGNRIYKLRLVNCRWVLSAFYGSAWTAVLAKEG